MALSWISDSPPLWDADKARLVAGAPDGIFDHRYRRLQDGDLAPGTWWRVQEDDRTVGFAWLDVVWGDAQILLVTDPDARSQGIGKFMLERLDREASQRGLNYLFNTVRSTHPERGSISKWLEEQGFEPKEDGSLKRRCASSS